VPLTDCHFLIEDAEGERRVTSRAGEAYRRDAGVEHNVINGGDQPMSFVEIEYK
jgi:mannose-6-phosphate isomerase-like protein (cupin superfamily)